MQSIVFNIAVLACLGTAGSFARAEDAVPAAAPAASTSASANGASSGAPATSPADQEILAGRPAEFANFCLIPSTPSSTYPYAVLKKLKVGKQTYGSVRDVLPELVDKARAMGADAIVDYNGSQRFGLLPWRMVRPVVTGTAVRWIGSSPGVCSDLGGATVKEVLESNRAPAR